jgi:hypothetical protein
MITCLSFVVVLMIKDPKTYYLKRQQSPPLPQSCKDILIEIEE